MSERLAAALCCPACHGALGGDDALRCRECGTAYPSDDGVLRLVAGGGAAESDGFYDVEEGARYGRDAAAMPDELTRPVHELVRSLRAEALIVEVGSGRGAFDALAPGYVAVDLSLAALRAWSSGARVQASAEALPFRDGSVDAVFTIASLEHVPNPEQALAEIDRVLCPGGTALVYPAWYVRPWASKALHKRGFRELGTADRMRKLTIPLRDRREYQFARALPARVRRELRLRRGRPLRFEWRPLDPNFDEYLTSDSDAFSSMDPHAASAFFVSRGYEDLRRTRARARLLYAYEPVLVRKPAPSSS